MKTPYKNIYTVLKLNRFIVLSVVIVAFLSSGFALWSVFKLNHKMLNSMFAVNTDGSVIPLKIASARDNLEVEARAHLKLFHRSFYGLNTSNYEDQLDQALWLGNQSVDNVYRQKKNQGVYNRIIQYSLVQKVLRTQSELDLSKKPYSFQCTTILEIHRGEVVDTYELVSSGNLIKVDRHFPRNTHGLLITNYFENSLKRITDENR